MDKGGQRGGVLYSAKQGGQHEARAGNIAGTPKKYNAVCAVRVPDLEHARRDVCEKKHSKHIVKIIKHLVFLVCIQVGQKFG